MRIWLISFLCWVARKIISLRYKIKIEGLDLIDEEHLNKGGGKLILPNHPAHTDPLILFIYLWPKLRMRPMAVEYMYRKPFVSRFMKMANALPIPDFETSTNEIKLEKGRKTLAEVKKGLKKKQSFLLYPSGRLKHGGKEIIGGASATHEIIQECPDTNVILVRTIGLWGSMFSRALSGTSPEFLINLKKGIKIILKNLILFAPRRKISIKIEPNPKDFPWTASRLDLNRYLEDFYNQYPSHKDQKELLDTEPLMLVSYAFYKKDYPDIAQAKKFQKRRLPNNIPPKVKKDIYDYLASISELKAGELEPKMGLAIDLGLDSLDVANVIAYLSDHYDVKSIHPEEVDSIQDVLALAVGKLDKPQGEEVKIKHVWPIEKKRLDPSMPEGKTIFEAFLERVDKMGHFAAIADDLSGVLSYDKLKLTVMVLALEIRKLPGKYQAIMLPSSCGAYITILATLFANKIPVMLNWTLGPRYLNEMMKVTGAKKVLTSWKFLERISNVEFGDLKQDLILLEDLRKKISITTKLKGFALAKRSKNKILNSFKLNKKSVDDIAVVLFTSGTESVPKAVPLSHKNIISNQQAAIQCVSLKASDCILGILPPFHSFGFSVAGLFPILAGLKVAYYPDPTDSFALAARVKHWQTTLFCGAPNFINGLLSSGSEKQLKSLRIIVTGAEKAPSSLFRKINDLNSDIITIEGYGITECSPMISLTRPNEKRVGVGQLLPGIKGCTIHPETKKLLEDHKEGEICISGSNVFAGYLDKKSTPFAEMVGMKWYMTGDLGIIDKDNHVILSGRLKRFAKIGGEMISLGGIEEIITEKLLTKKEQEEGSQIALCVDETDESKSTLVLFTALNLEKKQINELLRNEGFSRLVKISVVIKIDSLPMLGTGKIDYRSLQSMI
jgi:acyl-CoA synthetase (AMP-forming)/AMP-acid ligase II/1-acyl-sn-glycerol-3-phosphate acyltransferase/acyl carrier protein